MRRELDRTDSRERRGKYLCCRDETPMPAHGKLYWETTVLYGDPAWDARLKPATEPLYDQSMEVRKLPDGKHQVTFEVKMLRGKRPSRPAAFLLSEPLGSVVEVLEGPEDLAVADNFALVPFWPPGEPAPEKGRLYKAVVLTQPGGGKADSESVRER